MSSEENAGDVRRNLGLLSDEIRSLGRKVKRLEEGTLEALMRVAICKLSSQLDELVSSMNERFQALKTLEEAERGAILEEQDEVDDKLDSLRSRIEDLDRLKEAYICALGLDQEIEGILPRLEDYVPGCKDLVTGYQARFNKLSMTVKTLNSPQLQELFDKLKPRIQEVYVKADQRGREDIKRREKSSPSPEVEKKPETIITRSSLRLKLPSFDGDILKWRDFWALFSAVLEKEPRLTDTERCCHLLEAMSTPEAKSKARDAIAYTSSYKEAVERLQEVYDRNRIVFSHHVKGFFTVDHFGDNRNDLQRLQDRLERHIRGMKQSKGYTPDQIVAMYCEQCMNPKLLTAWRNYSHKYADPPPVSEMLDFIKKQLLTIPDERTNPKVEKSSSKQQLPAKKTVLHLQNSRAKCSLCNNDHFICMCPEFQSKTVAERLEYARARGLCFNCLHGKHRSSACTNKKRCQECSGKHHSLLHHTRTAEPTGPEETAVSTVARATPKSEMVMKERCVLPRTALVVAMSGPEQQKARVQLDSGAAINLITSKLAKSVGAERLKNSASVIKGVSGFVHSPYQVQLTLKSMYSQESISIEACVIDDIPATFSCVNMKEIKKQAFLKGLDLADPDYTPAARIDILLCIVDANLCLRTGVAVSPDKSLRAEDSIFGWTIGGRAVLSGSAEEQQATCLKVVTQEDDSLLQFQNIWKLDEIPGENADLTPEEQQAVSHFADTHVRESNGRYVVGLPRRDNAPVLGKSREVAVKRYLSNERLLKRRGKLDEFVAAVREYGELGHAELVPKADLNKEHSLAYYLPMHGVVKESSTTTKLRIVFDASARTSSGFSFNDTLLSGPSLYPNLPTVITKFRRHKIGMSSDISKMFREVGLLPREFDYHRFLLRNDEGLLQDWHMKRLTFGVTVSPYLATQVLRQLAEDYRSEFPLAASVVEQTFYVDDCLTGADSLQAAQTLREELNALLSRGQMTLRKWRTNSSELKDSIPSELLESGDLHITTNVSDYPKALGIHWSTSADTLHVTTPQVDLSKKVTKRVVSSVAAKIFDALGWFSPALVVVKIMLQEAWSLKITWDDHLPDELQQRWQSWAGEISAITEFPIPRCIGKPGKKVFSRQLHGFSDASTSAYGGVVYLRTVYEDTTVCTDLISSKTRVAPLRKLTVPRLELCGAVVLSKLLVSVAHDLSIPSDSIFAWTDSAVVLGQLHLPQSRLKVFVAHRVKYINSKVHADHWRYVDTACNPADFLSRGVSPKTLLSLDIWWNGPSWLKLDPNNWPRRHDIDRSREIPDLKPTVLKITQPIEQFGLQFSSYSCMLKVMGRILRFYNRIRFKDKTYCSKHLSLTELERAKVTLIALNQKFTYPDVLQQLKKKKNLSTSHPLSCLAPYLDDKGLMRVGGRLQKAALPSEFVHPIILSLKSHFVVLLVKYSHILAMHAGTATVMSVLSSSYYIPGMKKLLKKISRQCITCQKIRAKVSQQQMGELPASRVRPARPFSIVGIDYAGPLNLKRGNPRKPTIVKCYICVVVCFVSRAVHLEVVSDLISDAFIAALTRFAARRGYPSEVYSDNGTNFVGAQAELKQLYNLMKKDDTKQAIINWAYVKEIEWHFSPSRAPHFGGLWEAAVKSMKTLLKKCIGENKLTYEELTTVLAGAEAVLNSRPLVPLDAQDEEGVLPLTPGHFLTGGPLIAPPQRPDTQSKLSSLKRWNLVQRLNADLWKRWRCEYLQTLQKRVKWKYPEREWHKGDIVLLKDDNVFQRSWPMGKIVEIYPGTDGHVRVVDVLVKGKIHRRPVTRLVLLLGEDETSPRGENV